VPNLTPPRVVTWRPCALDGRRRVGDKAVQGNVDPAVLFAPPEAGLCRLNQVDP
jgi:uroporphyrinogen-III decarboxylase